MNHKNKCRYSVRFAGIIFLFTALVSCTSRDQYEYEFDKAQVVASLLVVGDGGAIADDSAALVRAHLELAPDTTSIVLLGDNIYPAGLPAEGDPSRAVAEGRLKKLIELGAGLAVRMVFVPGNHDWSDSGPDGVRAVVREAQFVTMHRSSALFLPKPSCPGPEAITLPGDFRVVGLDTQWWLHIYEKPKDSTSGCESFNDISVSNRLSKEIEAAGGDVIIATHHPMVSYADRHQKGGPQTMQGTLYAHLKEVLGAVFNRRSPRICIAGHDHGLQVITQSHGCRTVLVSGALSNTTPIGTGEGLQFASSHRGIMRIDRIRDRSLVVSVIETAPERVLGARRYSRVIE